MQMEPKIEDPIEKIVKMMKENYIKNHSEVCEWFSLNSIYCGDCDASIVLFWLND